MGPTAVPGRGLLPAAVAQLVVIALVRFVIADDRTLGLVIDVVFMAGSLIGVAALAGAIRRTTGRDRTAWSLVIAAGAIAVVADVVAPTRDPTTLGLAMAALVSVAGWSATGVMRSGAWTTVTIGRTAIDGIWVVVATVPAWWTVAIAPLLEHRDRLGTGALITLVLLSALALAIIADLMAALPRLEPTAQRTMVVLAVGGLMYLVASQLLAWEHLAGVSTERSLAAIPLAAIPVVAVLATRHPDLSRLVSDVRDIRELDFWAITILPLLVSAPVVVRAGTPTTWALAALGVLGVRAGLVVRENRQLLDTVEQQSRQDPLTGLANRRTLDDGDLAGRPVGACFIDLDGFKSINDAHGHQVGDELLRVVARRLESCVRHADVVLRVGGDEFVLLLVDATDPSQLHATAVRALERIEEPMTIGDLELSVGASIGVAHTPRWEGADPLLERADEAMYRAKRRGGRRVGDAS
ncbi:MAG: GGDEF domain-containing protein [Actinomycetota bacterium]